MTHFLQSRGLQKLFQFRGLTSKRLFHERLFSSFSHVKRDPLEENLTYEPFKRTDVKLLNEQLVTSVHQQNFPGAERLRLHLQSEFAFIEPHPVYERAALAQISSPAKVDLQAFLTWLHLVPDNADPSRVENGAMTKTRDTLFRTGTPARNLRLICEFSLVCAAKGYAQLVWDDLVRLLSRFEHADRAVAFFLEFENALLEYYKKYNPGEVETNKSRQRDLLILLCVETGWLEEAVRVVQASEGERIGRACERLVAALRARGDEANIALVEVCMQARRHDGAAPSNAPPPPKPSIAQRLGDLFSPQKTVPPPTHSYYSIRAIIERTIPPRPRPWIALKLRELKRAVRHRSLYPHKGAGKTLHQFVAHYIASSTGGYPRALLSLRKRALAASDTTAYTFITKELYYLHEARLFADIVAVFDANFESGFLPTREWGMLRAASVPEAAWRGKDSVPEKMRISSADAWVVWNALVRLSVSVPLSLNNSDGGGGSSDIALTTLSSLHHSAVHFASTLTPRQFLAFPTSYTTVFRSIVYAYSCVSPPQMSKAVDAARDLALIGQLHPASVGVWDELAAAYARAGDIRAVERLLSELEEVEPRLATYGVVMDAYLENGMVEEAVRVEARMKRKCEYVPGRNWRMDATLNALRWRRRGLPIPEDTN